MMSIVLALVLLAVLLVTCGPLAYKKLVKKCRCRCPPSPSLCGGDEEGSHLCFAPAAPLLPPFPPRPLLPLPQWPFSAPSNKQDVRNAVVADSPTWAQLRPTPAPREGGPFLSR